MLTEDEFKTGRQIVGRRHDRYAGVAGQDLGVAAMTDAALRMVPLFPDSASAQLSLCEGLEATLEVVAVRLRMLNGTVQRRQKETATIGRLAELLTALHADKPVALEAFAEIGAE